MVTHKATGQEQVYMGTGHGTHGPFMQYSFCGITPLCQVHVITRRFVGASTIRNEWVTCKKCLKIMEKNPNAGLSKYENQE